MSCAAHHRMSLWKPTPEQQKVWAEKISQALRGKSRPYASIRMRLNNPMKDPVVVEKMSRALRGRTFLARGGNGQPTKPQLLLVELMGLPMEYPILTAAVKGLLPSLPSCYKVDLADPCTKTAIEVDGSTHNTRKWKFLDHRKTQVLEALGWCVLRFSNQRVLNSTDEVVAEIRACITSRSQTTTTILLKGS